MLELLTKAIAERRIVSLDYDPGLRLIEPHCIGRSSAGEFLLRAFQVSGDSASGEHENWKLFRLDKARMMQLTNDHFAGARPEYNPNDKHMKGGIIARL
ncbi:MAG: hypothetical protein JNK46_12775 [Methylobacteriaceae bacterium]|nr:hypothetical protein [Methylobacteriaceae bacterium]